MPGETLLWHQNTKSIDVTTSSSRTRPLHILISLIYLAALFSDVRSEATSLLVFLRKTINHPRQVRARIRRDSERKTMSHGMMEDPGEGNEEGIRIETFAYSGIGYPTCWVL